MKTLIAFLVLISLPVALGLWAGEIAFQNNQISMILLVVGTIAALVLIGGFLHRIFSDDNSNTPSVRIESSVEIYNVMNGTAKIIEIEGTRWFLSPYGNSGEAMLHRMTPKGKFIGKPVIGSFQVLAQYLNTVLNK